MRALPVPVLDANSRADSTGGLVMVITRGTHMATPCITHTYCSHSHCLPHVLFTQLYGQTQ